MPFIILILTLIIIGIGFIVLRMYGILMAMVKQNKLLSLQCETLFKLDATNSGDRRALVMVEFNRRLEALKNERAVD